MAYSEVSLLFSMIFENYFNSSCNSFFYDFFLLSPEIFLILSIFVYLCFIKNFNSFYFSSLFFYCVLFLELILLVYQGFCATSCIVRQVLDLY